MPVRYFLVMDLEATRERDDRMWPNETIEFSAALLDARSLEAIDEFHEFVRPMERPELTVLCKDTTNITQIDVANSATLDVVMERFDSWLRSHGLCDSLSSVLPVICEDWNLKTMLPNECSRKGFHVPSVVSWWCNITKVFQTVCTKASGMNQMLEKLNIKVEDHHHPGIKHIRNIAKILVKLVRVYKADILSTSGTFPGEAKLCPQDVERRSSQDQNQRDESGSHAQRPRVCPSSNDSNDDIDCKWAQNSKPHARRWGKLGSAEASSKSQPDHVAKDKLRTSEDIFNRLRWDESSEHGEVFIGYEDRIEGPMEIVLSQFKPISEDGNIPFHRIWYFRRGDSVLWDRRRRLDNIFFSGCTPAILGMGDSQGFDELLDKQAADETELCIKQAQTTMKRLREEREYYRFSDDKECNDRRKTYQGNACSEIDGEDSKVYRTDVGEGKQGKGKGKGKNNRKGPEYDPWTPCGYFLAGYCHYGNKCAKQHSIPYSMAVRNDWLHPEQMESRNELQAAAVEAHGSEAVSKARLFPRVFASVLNECSVEALDPQRRACSSRNGHRFAHHSGLRFLLILDLEGKDEIIEFPVIAVDTVARCEIGRFQRYVRPAKLFEGLPCTCGSPAVPFTIVLKDFDLWLQDKLGCTLANLRHDTAFLTCGDWDCKHVRSQCRISGIVPPPAFSKWVNIKRTYQAIYRKEFRGMRTMLAMLGLLDSAGNVIVGFHHLGMHDVENIGRCVMHLVKEGHTIDINGAW